MNQSAASLPPWIQALCQPRAYAHPVEKVEVLQTHISWVLLAGEYAYKIKKPVKLPFLDFSTLSLRQRDCENELALNQAFAPELYVGVVAIGEQAGGLCMDAVGPALEWAVKMRRFEQAQRLDHVCGRGELTPAHLSMLADFLHQRYDQAEPAPTPSDWGSASLVAHQALENFDTAALALPHAGAQRRLQALRVWTEQQISLQQRNLQTRQRKGCVRACHGDLHLANMVLLDGQVRLFDCIEFSQALRFIDVLSDLAFVYVDLLARGQAGLANWWLSEALQSFGDESALGLLRFYAVYRAMVRLKVAALRQAQTGAMQDEIETYLALAEWLVQSQPSRLVITHGLSGSGKTVASAAWLLAPVQERRMRLRSDVQRKRLFGLTALADSGSAPGQGLYHPQASERTYAHLAMLAQQALAAGWSVVVDAGFLRHADRQDFAQLAQAMHASFHILSPKASLETLHQRIERRRSAGEDASEATPEVLVRQLQQLEPLQDSERQYELAIGPPFPENRP